MFRRDGFDFVNQLCNLGFVGLGDERGERFRRQQFAAATSMHFRLGGELEIAAFRLA